jgi:quinol-cytochrome oxidoreductase complex cytochrome b subunit
MPVLGPKVRFLLLGGNQVGENALLRFYVLHCVILPLVAVVFIGVHFWRVQKYGGLTAPDQDDRKG